MKWWIWVIIVLVIVAIVLLVRAQNKAAEERQRLATLQVNTETTNAASLLSTIKGWFNKEEEELTDEELEAIENDAFENLTEEELWS